MKKLATLFLLSSCITINSQGGAPGAPRALMAARAAAPAENGMMAYEAAAVLSSYNTEKARKNILASAEAEGGEILQDGTERILVRIPSEKLTNYIEGLKKFGKVESFSVRGENLAQPVEDNSLRLESLTAARGKYREILAKAQKVQDILAVTRELEQLDYQIQALQNQKMQNEKRIAFSELSVTLQKRKSFGPVGWVLYGVWRAVKWFFWWG